MSHDKNGGSISSGYPEIGSEEQKESGVKTKFRKLYANLSVDAMMRCPEGSESKNGHQNHLHQDDYDDSEDEAEDDNRMSTDEDEVDADDGDDVFHESFNPEPITTPDIEFFPTPHQEPQETLSVKYLGSAPASRPSGVQALNDAMEEVIEANKSSEACSSSGPESTLINMSSNRNIPVLIRVSPSSIIAESSLGNSSRRILDVRVRYLSFLGIHKTDVKKAGFIIQSGDKSFTAYCFECEPDAGEFCRIVESACKLRYQKCLDGHKQRISNMKRSVSAASALGKSASASVAAVKTAFSKMWSKK